MNRLFCSGVAFVVLLLSGVEDCSGGTTGFHRETSLDELKGIDSLVSTGLPLFSHGFFIATGRGPVLVKKGNNDDKTPRLNPGYYRTLPRLIPQGYEGIATSHFNLGSAFPLHQQQQFPLRQDEDLVAPPNNDETAPVPPTPQQHRQQGHQGHQGFQQQGAYFNRGSPTTASPPQFGRSFENQYQPQQQQEQQQPQQSQNYQTYFESSPPAQQHQHHEQLFQQHNQQQPLIQPPQVQQEQQQQINTRQGSPSSPVGQETFQIDNFLTAGDNGAIPPTSYQRTEFGHEQFVSHKFIRNPVVERAVAVDETLPEGLKNPFYRNEQLASALAQESLPVPGEQVVGEWDTTKIQKSKIHELLRGAGLI